MKRFFKSIVAVLLCLSMTVPFGAMSMKTNAAVELPDRPTAATGADKIYISYNSANTNGTKSSSTGGNTAALAYYTSTIDLWNKLMGITEGSTAKTVLGNSTFTNGGTMVNVAKLAFLNNDFTFPKTTTPLVITSKDGDTSYISRLEDGSLDYMTEAGKNGTQYGMILPGANNTIIFEGDVIFKDIVFLNRQNSTSTDTPTIFQAGGRFVIESSVEFASMTGNKKFTLDVTRDGCAFIDTLGFGKYTGTGTIIIGDDILASVKEAGRAANFADFEGRIVDKDGNAVFGEPTATSETVVYLSYDTKAISTVTINSATADGGDTPTDTYGTKVSSWSDLFNTGKAKEGGTIVIVGKGAISADLIIPATNAPIVFTSNYNGIDYASYNTDGSYNTATSGGQFGSLMLYNGKTITIKGDVIFDNLFVINRTNNKGTIKVEGTLVVKDNVGFASMYADQYHQLNVSEGGTVYLHALGFSAYSGTGTIVIGDEILYSVNEAMFEGFTGKIVDEYGRAINFDELTTAPEDTTTEAPESESSTPETESSTPETESSTPETESSAPESESSAPESESSAPESESSAPESDTETPEDSTVPDDTEEKFTIPERPTAPSNKVYISYDGNTNLEGAAPSVDGGASALKPYHTKSGTWGALLSTDMAKNGATFVLVGKGFFGNNFTFTGKDNTYVFTGKDGDVSYVSMDGDEILYTDATGASHVGQYGMFIVNPNCTVTFESNVIFKDTVILNRQTAGVSAANTAPILSVKNILVIEDSVQFASMNGNVKYTLNVEDGAFAFLDALGFGKYTGTGTIVLSDALAATAKKADFAGFEGKVVNKDGIEIFPGSAPSYPSKNNYVYIALNKTQAGGDTDVATEDGGATPEVPYVTSTANWNNIFSTKLTDGGYVVVVGKGYFGASCELPATSKPIVITAMNMDGTTSYISTNEDGSLNLTNANPSKGGGQYGMFLLNNSKSGYTLTFNGDVIFENIVILNRIATADVEKGIITSTIEVNKTLTIRDTVQFANLSGGKNYNLKVNEGATAYLDAAQFDSYSGSGTIVFGDNLKGVITKDNLDLFKDFTGKVVDKDGNDWFVTNAKTGECDYEYNWWTGVLKVTGNGSPAGLWRARYATEIIFGEGVTAIPVSFCLKNTNLRSVTLSSTIHTIDAHAFDGTVNLETINIPENSQISTVGKKAFLSSGITSIKFNDNLKSVGEYAFRDCNDLVSVDLGNGIESIGTYAFGRASSLTDVKFGGTITTLPDNVFILCKMLKSVDMSQSITKIGSGTFRNTNNLTQITLPEALTSIGSEAFKYSGLAGTLTIPDNVTEIGAYAFYKTATLTGIVLPTKSLSLGEYCFAFSGLTSLEIPSSVDVIAPKAFYTCSSLTSVNISNGPKTIGDYAFANTGITSVTIPESVTTLNNGIFQGCVALTTANLNCTADTIPNKTFYNCRALSSVTLPTGTKTIDTYAFYKCNALASITLPDALTSIGEYAFSFSGLTELTLPKNLAVISTKAFQRCTDLQTVTVNDSLTTIDDYAFIDSGITSITIPESVTNLGDGIFYNCTALTTASINSASDALPEKTFNNCPALSSVTLPAGMQSIGAFAFYKCSALASITLPDTLSSIGTYAFSGTALTELTLPAGLITISTKAFEKCAALTTVNVNDALTTIGDYAFFESGITSFVVPESCTNLGNGIFYNCASLTTVDIQAAVTSIPTKTFYECRKLATAIIPDTVTQIHPYAFYRCSALKSIDIPSKLKYIYTYAFAYTTKLKMDITMPDTVKLLGDYAFIESGITGLTLSNNLTTIGGRAFYKCPNLTIDLIIPESVATIGEKAFCNTNLTNVYIPSSVTTIVGEYAFKPAADTDPLIPIHTEESAAAVIAWANKNNTKVTLSTDYVPASKVTE